MFHPARSPALSPDLSFSLSLCHTGQLHVTECLCHSYSKVCPDLQACITYHEHWASLARQLQDRELEGSARQALSQLYQALGTPE